MNDAAAAAPRRRRWPAVLVRIALVLTVALVLVWAARNTLLAPFALRYARAVVAERLGLALEAGAVRGDWTSWIAVDDVRLDALDERGELRSFAARSVTVELDAWDALRGREGWLKRIEVEEGDVRVDLGAPSARPNSGSEPPVQLPASWPALAASKLDALLRLPDGRALELEGGDVRLASSAEAAGRDGAFKLSVERFALVGDWPIDARAVEVSASGRLRPERVEVAQLELVGDVVLAAGRASLELPDTRDRDWRFEVAGQSFGGEFDFRARAGAAAFEASFATRDVDLARVLGFALVDPSYVSSGVASVDGELSSASDGVWLALRGTVRDGCVMARPIDSVELDGAWTPHELWLAFVDASEGANSLAARGVRVPRGLADARESLRAARGEIALLARDVPSLIGADAPAPAHQLDLSGRLDERGFTLSSGALRTLGGSVWIERGAVEWASAPAAEFVDALLDLELRTEFSDLGQLGAVLGEPRWSGSCVGQVSVSGPARSPTGVLDLVGDRVVIGPLELGAVETLLRLEGGRLDVERMSSAGALGELEATARVDLTAREILAASLRCSTEDVAGFARAVGAAAIAERLSGGALEIEASVSGELTDPDGALELRASDATVEGATIDELVLRGSRERDRWTVEEFFARSGDYALAAAGDVRYSLGETHGLARLERLALHREELSLHLAHPVFASYSHPTLHCGRIDLTGSAGSVTIDARAAPDDVLVELRMQDFEPLTVLGPFVPDDARCGPTRGELTLVRDGSGWNATSRMELEQARWSANWPIVDASVVGRASEYEIDLDQLVLDGGEAGSLEVGAVLRRAMEGGWTLAEADGRASGALQRFDLARWPWRELGLDLELSGMVDSTFELRLEDGEPRGHVTVRARELAAVYGDGGLGPTGFEVPPSTLELDARLDRDVVVERCELIAPDFARISVEGTLGGAAAWLAAGGEKALPDDARLALTAKWEIDDVRWMAALSEAVRRVEGSASGELSLAGSWSAPRADGQWSWSDGALRLGADAPPFERIQARGSFSGSRIEIELVSGELGAGPFELRGSVDFAGDGQFDLALEGRELLVLRDRDLRARADAELKLTGPFSAPTLSGRVGVREGLWRQRIEWLPTGTTPAVARREGELPFTIRGGALESLRYDVAIEPAGEFLIDTNLAKINLRPDLHLGGRASDPTLEGAIYLDPTRVTLPGSTLDLRAGTLLFDPYRSATPMVDVTATTRVLGYDITARLTGRIDSIERELTSTPPLRSEAISVLLLTGRAPRDVLSNQTGAEAAQSVIVFLGKDLLSTWTGGRSTLTERIEWRSGSDMTRAGGSTAEVTVRVTGEATGEGSALYLRGERDIYDRINYGVRFVVRMR